MPLFLKEPDSITEQGEKDTIIKKKSHSRSNLGKDASNKENKKHTSPHQKPSTTDLPRLVLNQ
jgi:hypothetical protein